MIKKLIKLFSSNHKNRSSQNVRHSSESPLSAEELKKIGEQHYKNRELEQAAAVYIQLIVIDPLQHEAHKNLGVVYYYQGKLMDALRCHDRALELNPDYPEALNARGLALNDLNRLDEALIDLERAIALKPDFAFAHNNRGLVLRSMGKTEEALASFDDAIKLNPDYAEPYNNKATMLEQLEKRDEALVNYDRAIALKLNYFEAYANRAMVLAYLNRAEEALISVDKAIAIKSDFAVAHNTRGMILSRLGKRQEALLSYGRAIAIKPDFAEAYSNRGALLCILNRMEEALANYDRAIVLKPDLVDAHNGKGDVLGFLNRLDEALKAYDVAIKHMKHKKSQYWPKFEIKMRLCDWSDYDGYIDYLKEVVEAGLDIIHPFTAMALSDSALLQKRLAEIFSQAKYPPSDSLPIIKGESKKKKIRLAYFSADFRSHAVSYLIAELFERHDKTQFEIIAFSLVSVPDDEMQKRIKSSFDQFIDVSHCSNLEAASIAREMKVDIAVDLGGFTMYSRAEIFALRAAPIQVNYLGYPGTMGAQYMDYIIADATLIPPDYRKFYTEKVIYLPSFQANDTQRIVSSRQFTREELGLPATAFVYCCFNNIHKFTPHRFNSWMRILKQVDNSVLWLLDDNSTTVRNLIKEAASQGVDSDRIVFAKRVSLPDYLARYRMADLFLDTIPFNAGTTASDALWAGLPVLTQIGETFAGRMAASLLNAIHLPELITKTPQEYEALAIELATNPDKLAKIKQKLADNRLTTPLFDIEYFTKNIESAYTQMYERYHAGLAPDHIYVDNPYSAKQ